MNLIPNFRVRWGAALALFGCATGLRAQGTDPQHLFEEAVAAQQRGDDASAVRAYQELLRLRPDAVAVRVNLGATLAEMKRYREAIEQYRVVLAADPSNRMARMNLALAYQGNDNLRDAIKELERLHQEDANDTQGALLLADCLVQAARYADATALLSPMEAAQPGNLDLEWLLGSAMIHDGRAPQGIDRVENAAAKGANADAYLLAGQTRLAMNQYDLAQRDADAAQRLNPGLEGLPTLNGMILEQTGDYDAAEKALRKALTVSADDFNAHLYLGGIYYFRRNLDQAKLHLTRALELQPNSAQAQYELALVARTEGHLDVALKYLETLVRQSPDWLQPHVELASLYYRLHRPEEGAKERHIVDGMMATQQQSQSQGAH